MFKSINIFWEMHNVTFWCGWCAFKLIKLSFSQILQINGYSGLRGKKECTNRAFLNLATRSLNMYKRFYGHFVKSIKN